MAEHFKFPPKTMSLFCLLNREKTFYKILISTIFDQKMTIMYMYLDPYGATNVSVYIKTIQVLRQHVFGFFKIALQNYDSFYGLRQLYSK